MHMPLLKNAIKKMRQDKKRTEHNKGLRSQMRTFIKIALTDKTAENLSKAYSELDRAAKKHLIHKGKASRLKSRLAQAIAKTTETVVATKKKATKKGVTKKTTKKATVKTAKSA
jgi:small subunit ribosomal protein S20